MEGIVNVYEKNLGISPQTLSDNIENVVGIERTSVVMPAVVEPAPAVVGRGGHLSSKYQDRLSIKNVENDERGLISGKTRTIDPYCHERTEGRPSVLRTHHVHHVSGTG